MNAPPVDSFKKRQEDAKKKQNGEMAPDVDQDGKMINPHNPDFITKVPWYLGSSGPTLKHHNIQKVDHVLSMNEANEIIKSKVQLQQAKIQQSSRTVFRPGSCKNCGAMTHKEKDCVERPRSVKKSAWKSGLDIAADEVKLNLEDHGKVSYAAKRDYWKGYDTTQYKDTIERFQKEEEERRKFKQEQKELKRTEQEENKRKQKQEKKQSNGSGKRETKTKGLSNVGDQGDPQNDNCNNSNDNKDISNNEEDDDPTARSSGGENSDSDSDSDCDSDEDNDDEEDDTKEFMADDQNARDFQNRVARQGGVGGAEMKTTTRNLRIREDTPKYLRNLALDSAHYDPKARSMRSNPFPDENPEDLAFAGDNFLRHSGDALKLAANQVLCWEMQARGEDIDLLSNPSQAELVQRQFVDKKKALEDTRKRAILEKYGNGNAQPALDPRLRLGQTEVCSEYTRDGRPVGGPAKPRAVTKYEEDVYINNHKSVWGSYYSRARKCWGYQCCHSLIKNSICTGEKGKAALDAGNSQVLDVQQARRMLESKTLKDRQKDDTGAQSFVHRNDVFGEASNLAGGAATQLNSAKLQKALSTEESWHQQDHSDDLDDRKRAYNSARNEVEITPEYMEAYRLKKQRNEDPMAALLDGDSDTLLEYK